MANIELDGVNKKIKVDSGDLTLDVPGDIILDADGADLVFADGGTNILKVTNSSSDVVFQPQVDAKDIIFKQYDGTTVATVEDNATFNIPASKLAIGGTAVTSTAAELNILDGVTSTAAELNILDGVTSTTAELNIMDGVTATAAEINLIDGGTARGTTAVADGDGVLINDAGTMRMTSVETLKTYMSAEKNNPSFSAKMANHQQVGDNVLTKVAFDTANYQTSGTYDTSNYRFTPGVAGNYQFIIQIQGNSKANANLHSIMIKLYKNGSVLGEHVDGIHTNYATSYIFAGNLTFNLTTASDADDYFEVYAAVNDTSSTPEVNKYGSHFSGFLISGSA